MRAGQLARLAASLKIPDWSTTTIGGCNQVLPIRGKGETEHDISLSRQCGDLLAGFDFPDFHFACTIVGLIAEGSRLGTVGVQSHGSDLLFRVPLKTADFFTRLRVADLEGLLLISGDDSFAV